jgi:probable rRNA maturation factor
MTVEIHLSNRQRKFKVDLSWLEETAENLLLATCANLKADPSKLVPKKIVGEIEKRGTLGLTLLSNEQIKKLNHKWRQKNSATDVLSFPLGLEIPGIADVPFELGEIMISLETAYAQAKEYGHSKERELAFLFVHGCLHVLGFDHETKAEELEMFSRQKKILESAGFSRR